jgi:hypothetical protein
MSPIASIAAAAALLASASLALPSAAADHPRVPALDCGAVAASIGAKNVWHARFYGERVNILDRREWYLASPCFKTESNCKNWLYWAQTDYPQATQVQFCRRGLRG